MDIDCVIGMSLDGRIDWISDPEILSGLFYKYVMEKTYDAILCGSSTMLNASYDIDNEVKYSDQTLIVVDSKGRINNWPVIKRQAWWNGNPIVLCSKSTPDPYLEYAKQNGVEVIINGSDKVDLKKSTAELEGKGFKTIRMDSGGTLIGQMLRNNLLDHIAVLIAPQLTGGTSPKSIFIGDDLTTEKDIIQIKLKNNKTIKNDYVLLEYDIIKS